MLWVAFVSETFGGTSCRTKPQEPREKLVLLRVFLPNTEIFPEPKANRYAEEGLRPIVRALEAGILTVATLVHGEELSSGVHMSIKPCANGAQRTPASMDRTSDAQSAFQNYISGVIHLFQPGCIVNLPRSDREGTSSM